MTFSALTALLEMTPSTVNKTDKSAKAAQLLLFSSSSFL